MSDSRAWDILNALPLFVTKGLFSLLSRLHYTLDSRHVKECESMVNWSNLEGNGKTIVRDMYFNLWKIIPEILAANKKSWQEYRNNIHGIEEFCNYVAQHKGEAGVVFVTGHLGNWELCGQVLSQEISPMLSVFKPHKQEWINRFFHVARNRSGQEIVAKEGAMLSLFKKVKRGGIVGLVIDQYGGHEGIDSTFLGKACKSWDSSVLLAHRCKVPLIPVVLIREGSQFRLRWKEKIDLQYNNDDVELNVQQSVQLLDTALEELVKEAPGQWMWLGRRWGRDFLKIGTE